MDSVCDEANLKPNPCMGTTGDFIPTIWVTQKILTEVLESFLPKNSHYRHCVDSESWKKQAKFLV